MKLLWIALAGAAGTLARYFLGGLVHATWGGRFPWGTLVVNGLGCFLFGVVWTLAEERLVISAQTRLVLLTGFMGAFTTFSSFSFETAELLRRSEHVLAATNVLAQIMVGMALFFLGLAVGRWL